MAHAAAPSGSCGPFGLVIRGAATVGTFGACALCRRTPDRAKDDVVNLQCSNGACGANWFCGSCLREFYVDSPGGKIAMAKSVKSIHASPQTLAMRDFHVETYVCPASVQARVRARAAGKRC